MPPLRTYIIEAYFPVAPSQPIYMWLYLSLFTCGSILPYLLVALSQLIYLWLYLALSTFGSISSYLLSALSQLIGGERLRARNDKRWGKRVEKRGGGRRYFVTDE